MEPVDPVEPVRPAAPAADGPAGSGERDAAGHGPPAATAAVGAEGRVTGWSAGATRLLGHAPREVLGRPVHELLAERLPGAVRARVAAGGEWEARIALRHRDGHRVLARLRAHPMWDGDGGVQWFLRVGEPRLRPDAATAGGPPALALGEWTLDQFPFPLAVFDERTRMVRTNEAMTVLIGRTEEDVFGRRLPGLAGVPQAEMFEEVKQHVLRTGETVVRENTLPAFPGGRRTRTWQVWNFPLRDAEGAVRGVTAALVDFTEEALTRRRLTIVGEAGARVGTTLDVAGTARELAELAVERFADFVTVDLLDPVLRGEEGSVGPGDAGCPLRRAAQCSVLAGTPEAVHEVGAIVQWPDYAPYAQVLATRQALRHSRLDEHAERLAEDVPDAARSMYRHGIHSLMAVPLSARGATLGIAVFHRHRTPEPYTEEDLLVAEEITARAAVCVDNARRYTRERAVSLALQRSMLPSSRAGECTAVSVAFRYLPAEAAAGVGGDWFDVIRLGGARIALVVGDVAGRGVYASAATGRLRMAVRTLADVDLPPDELLTHLDDLVVRLREEGSRVVGDAGGAEERAGGGRPEENEPVEERERSADGSGPAGPEPSPSEPGPEPAGDEATAPGGTPPPPPSPSPASHPDGLPAPSPDVTVEIGATCLYAVYDPVARRLSVARAGHPAPVVVGPDGTVRTLPVPPGPVLGVGGLPFESVDLDIEAGSRLVLYTDALLRREHHGSGRDDTGPEEGLALLHHALTLPAATAEDVCDTVLRTLGPAPDRSDIALLVAETHALPPDDVAVMDVPTDPAAVAEVRRWTTRRLAAWDLDEAAFVTELVATELVTNAIRHARAPVQLRLIRDSTLICEVSDASNAAPHMRRARTYDEGGRGLLLVAQLTQRWGTRHTPHGKVIWAEQTLPPALP